MYHIHSSADGHWVCFQVLAKIFLLRLRATSWWLFWRLKERTIWFWIYLLKTCGIYWRVLSLAILGLLHMKHASEPLFKSAICVLGFNFHENYWTHSSISIHISGQGQTFYWPSSIIFPTVVFSLCSKVFITSSLSCMCVCFKLFVIVIILC